MKRALALIVPLMVLLLAPQMVAAGESAQASRLRPSAAGDSQRPAMVAAGEAAVRAGEASRNAPPVGSPQAGPHIDETFVVGKVKAVSDGAVDQALLKSTGMVTRKQLAQVEIVEGPLQGTTITVPNEITDNPAFNVEAIPGHELVLSVVTENGSKPEFNIADYHRVPVLGTLLAVFLAVFLFFGGKQGFKSLIGLVIGIVLIASVLLPMSFHGFNPLITAALICVAVTATTTILVGGFSRKTLAATLGTVGGVIIAGIAAHLVIVTAPLTGLSSEEAQILRGSVLNQPPQFYSGLLAAGMLIGALGVIMDVAVSIASAVSEVASANTSLNRADLYRKGMNVGRDIMGTMTNTLVLAYTGSALPLLLLMAQIPSTKLLNLDLVATEVASALTGSLGLICTIPLTAFAAAHLMGRRYVAAGENAQASRLRPSMVAAGGSPLKKQSMSSSEAEFERMLWSHSSAPTRRDR